MGSIKETAIEKLARTILAEENINPEQADFFETSQDQLIDLLVSAYRAGIEDATNKHITEVDATWQLKRYTEHGFKNVGKPQPSRRAALKAKTVWMRNNPGTSEPYPHRIA